LRPRFSSVRSRQAFLLTAVFLVFASLLLADPLEDVLTRGTNSISLGAFLALPQTATNAATGAMLDAGYLGVFSLMFLEATSLPIPSEVVLPFAGYMVSTGRLDLWVTVAVAALAGVAGGLIDYYVGMFLGKRLTSNYGSRFFLSPQQMSRIETLFQRHGAKLIFASRLIPGIRTLASFPAGSARMKLSTFILYTALGCLVFDAALVYTGDYLGSNWEALRSSGTLDVGATAAVVVIAALVFIKMHRESVSRASPPE